jgi:hypothetical protein
MISDNAQDETDGLSRLRISNSKPLASSLYDISQRASYKGDFSF